MSTMTEWRPVNSDGLRGHELEPPRVDAIIEDLEEEIWNLEEELAWKRTQLEDAKCGGVY